MRATGEGGSQVRSQRSALLAPAADEALRVLGAELLRRTDALAERLTATMVAREPAYTRLELAEELRTTCSVIMTSAAQVLADQVPEGVDPGESSRRTGRRRARQGVPLEAVLLAYRLGGRMLWEALLELSRGRFAGRYDASLLDAAAFVWRISDQSSIVLIDAYRREALCLHARDVRRQHAVLDGLVAGRGADQAFLREAAEVLGLPEEGPLLCMVVIDGPGDDDAQRRPQEALVAADLASVFCRRPHDVVGLVALAARPAGTAVDILRACADGRVGVSPVLPGLAAVPAGHRMAHTAARTLTADGVAVLDERLPEALLVESPWLGSRLVQVALGELMALPAVERDLLRGTLVALLTNGGSPTRAAAALYCHRNTVIARMRRIEAITHRSVGDPRDRLVLALALMASG